MITVDPEKCCGCEACVQRCPRLCISMRETSEGFLLPIVDPTNCINCRLCELVCPFIGSGDNVKEPIAYAGINKDDHIRANSSSGGAFYLICQEIIAQKGIIYGAKFDTNWSVIHASTESLEGVREFMGSKYVQSRIGNIFKNIEFSLKAGRQVLFSGTPCQVLALKKFLIKDYPNLLTVDIVCHGVPSPGVWQHYLNSIKAELKRNTISAIKFRSKKYGWHNYGFLAEFYDQSTSSKNSCYEYYQAGEKNPFLRGFLADLYLRPSCYFCQVKDHRSGSDITLGDFWGIEQLHPEVDDNKGVSLILINSEKGERIIDKIPIEKKRVSYLDAKRYNPSISKATPIPINRQDFFAQWKKVGFQKTIDKLAPPPTYLKVIRQYISSLLPTSIKKYLRFLIKMG